jgi:hypothetical protein
MKTICFILLVLPLSLSAIAQVVDSGTPSIRRKSKTLLSECKLSSDEHIFSKVEVLPEFPGGAAKWFEFSQSNFDFSGIAKSLSDSTSNYHDSTQVKFVVAKNGDICGLTFLTFTQESLKTAVLDLFSKSPNWNPAENGNRQVNAYKTLVIEVSLDKGLQVGKVMKRYSYSY